MYQVGLLVQEYFMIPKHALAACAALRAALGRSAAALQDLD